MRGTVSKRIRRYIEARLGPEQVLDLQLTGQYNRIYRRTKRAYVQGIGNSQEVINYYGELEKNAPNIPRRRAVM